MNIDDIHVEWEKDTDMNPSNLTEEARKIPKLHAKYYRYYTYEHSVQRKMEADLKRLKVLRTEWHDGSMAEEDLKEYGWEPNLKRTPKGYQKDLLEADSFIIKMKLKIGDATEKVDLLENIIKSINNRGFLITNMINFEKFRTGAI
jgi:hypothetical protein